MLSRPIPHVASAPLGLFPTYCLTASDSLNASYDFSGTVVRGGSGKFLDREVTVSDAVVEETTVAARGKVVELSTFTPKADEFDPTPEMIAAADPVLLSGGVMAGKLLNRVQPIYPQAARTNGIVGTVVLSARIGVDGHIHSLRPMSAPDPDLAVSAVAAVRQWTYTPFLLNGVAVDVTTTITVNFNLNY